MGVGTYASMTCAMAGVRGWLQYAPDHSVQLPYWREGNMSRLQSDEDRERANIPALKTRTEVFDWFKRTARPF